MLKQSAFRGALTGLLAVLLCALGAGAWAAEDVVLLLDNSATMNAADPQHSAVRAATDFVNSRAPEARIAVITAGVRPAVLLPLTPINGAGRAQILATLRRLAYAGRQSNISDGLQLALAEIINHGNDNAQKSIILVTANAAKVGTAGAAQNPGRWIRQSLLPAAVYNHVRVFCLTPTSGADAGLLRAFTDRTGGEFVQVHQPDDFAAAFQHVAVALVSAPPAAAANLLPLTASPTAGFSSPLTRRAAQTPQTRWLWLVALLALIAAAFGIYAAWNMRLVRMPRKLRKPDAPPADGPRAVLYDISNPNDIKRYELAERATLLGRVAGYDPEVQYILVREKTVGRCHAVIERRGHSFWIMDQDSINGTFVNGERIAADRALKHGDIIAIHRHEFEFMIPEYFESEATIVGAREQVVT